MRCARSLLWIDAGAGLIAGTLTIAFAQWLSTLYALPITLVIVMGFANMTYGSFSLGLARRRVRPLALLRLLVIANAAWAVCCILIAGLSADVASVFGVGQLVAEATFVGGLALLEWRYRDALLTAPG